MSVGQGVLDGAIPPAENTHLFGHRDVVSFLAKSYRGGNLHHALLLEGPEGIGKATLAYRFANHILKHKDPASAPDVIADPDPDAAISRQLSGGASHHLLHLARPVDVKTGRVKSAITVEEVRRAGHFLAQTSGTGNWRIVVIDPADDMNRSAANAILKILEEPPRKTVFLVLSHAPGKLLPTIRSRCMPIRLAPLDDADMLRGLELLDLTVHQDPEMLATVLHHAKGSLSNALLLLRYGGLEIAEAFEQILLDGPAKSRAAIHKLAETLTAKDRDMAFGFFIDYATNRVMGMARQAAQNGDLSAAEHWASLSSQLQENLAIADGYNLDRKQTIISLISSFFRMPVA